MARLLLVLVAAVFSAPQEARGELVHPGVLLSREMLEGLRASVKAGREPQHTAFLTIQNSSARLPAIGSRGTVWLADPNYTALPQQLWIVNASQSPGTRWLSCKEDSLAAYTHALLWFITEQPSYAAKAAEIMDAWSAVLTQPVTPADGLEAAWSGAIWARAAELINTTASAGVWPARNASAFGAMLEKTFLPLVDEGASTNGNIAFVMSEAALGIGVFTDNQTTVDTAIALWRQQAPAYVFLRSDGPTPKRPPQQRFLLGTAPVCGPSCTDKQIVQYWHGTEHWEDGVAQETCRDLGHTEMLFSAMVNFAETAFHQGIDLYKEEQVRIIAGAEFHASLLSDEPLALKQNWPSWLCGGKCTGEHCNPAKATGETFEMVHHHYVHRLNLSLPNVTALLRGGKMRPTGCFDQLCWETLTHGDPLPPSKTDDSISSPPPCCSNHSAVPWQSGWVCDRCPPTCSVCRGSGNRSGPTEPCSSIKWNRGPWGCVDCPMQCSTTGGHKPSPPGPPPKPKQALPLHPFSAGSHGDVNGPFEHNGTYHLFKCCDWEHLIAPSAAGPWRSLGVETSPAAGGHFISGSVTVVDGVPRAVMPYNAGNNHQCCVGKPSDGMWKYREFELLSLLLCIRAGCSKSPACCPPTLLTHL